MTHCQREFFHAQWKAILDDEFLDAYEHGVVIECWDGKKRRFYLRIFAYSADYPEKYVQLFFLDMLAADRFVLESSLVVFETWVIAHALGVLSPKIAPIN